MIWWVRCFRCLQDLIDKAIEFGDAHQDGTVLAKVVDEKKALKVIELLPRRTIAQNPNAGFLAVSKDFKEDSIDIDQSAAGTFWYCIMEVTKTGLKDFGTVILENELYIIGGYDEDLWPVNSVGCILFCINMVGQ